MNLVTQRQMEQVHMVLYLMESESFAEFINEPFLTKTSIKKKTKKCL